MSIKAEEVVLEDSTANEDVENATLLEGVKSMTVIDSSGTERAIDFEVVDAFPTGEHAASGDSLKRKAGCAAAMCTVIIALVVWLSFVLSALPRPPCLPEHGTLMLTSLRAIPAGALPS